MTIGTEPGSGTNGSSGTPVALAGESCGPLLCEQREGNCIAHRLVSGRGRVEVVAAIVGRQEPLGMLRVPHHRVEVDYRSDELATVPDKINLPRPAFPHERRIGSTTAPSAL